jgi:hypothetical protein
MSSTRKSCITGNIAVKMHTIYTNAHLTRTDDFVYKMSEISTHENLRSGVKYYWGTHKDSM